MGLASFNRMRLRRIEEMTAENIEKQKMEHETDNQEFKIEVPTKEAVAEIIEDQKEEVATRGSKRKK